MTPQAVSETTRTLYARVAGFTLLIYIAIGISQMAFFGGTTAGEGAAAKLATMAQRATDVRINVILGLLTCFVALVLGVALYVITRDEDPHLALLALACRIGEGVIGSVFVPITLGLLSLATQPGGGVEPTSLDGLVLVLLAARSWNPIIAATFFAVGSTLFTWLLLRGRMIPAPLAWLGLLASILLVVGLPLQLADALPGSLPDVMWLPMALFEIPAGLWLLIKGVPLLSSRGAPAHAEHLQVPAFREG